MLDRIQFRPAKEEDLSTITLICQEDDTVETYRLYSKAFIVLIFKITRDHPGGFVVAELDGRVIGVMIVHVLGPDLCFGGINTVTKEFRGSGVGRALFRQAIAFVGERNFAVVSVDTDDLRQAYENKGFGIVGVKYNNFTGKLDKSCLMSDCKDVKIVDVKAVDIGELDEYDRNLCIRGRASFVQTNCFIEGIFTLVALKGEKIIGYGCLDTTHCIANRIGPVYADDFEVAKAILLKLVCQSGERKTFMLSTNGQLCDHIEKWSPSFVINIRGLSLFSKEKIEVEHENVFAVSNYTVYLG